MALQAEIEPRSTLSQKPDWSFYLGWIGVTVLALPIAFVLTLVIMRIIITFVGDYLYVDGVRHITEDYLAMYFLVPLAGLVTGVMQYGLLRRTLPRMGGWVLATLGGWLLGMLLVALLSRLVKPDILSRSFDLALLLMGFSIGVVQWLLLRRRLPRAGWWVAASLLGWGLLALATPGNSVGMYGLLLVGLIPACPTAAALALLMRQRKAANFVDLS